MAASVGEEARKLDQTLTERTIAFAEFTKALGVKLLMTHIGFVPHDKNNPAYGVMVDRLKRICDEYLPGKYQIEVIDLLQQPQLAAGDEILAIPTLVRKLPEPLRKIVGDLRNTERTLVGLNLRPSR